MAKVIKLTEVICTLDEKKGKKTCLRLRTLCNFVYSYSGISKCRTLNQVGVDKYNALKMLGL